jgi:hypothetical protein
LIHSAQSRVLVINCLFWTFNSVRCIIHDNLPQCIAKKKLLCYTTEKTRMSNFVWKLDLFLVHLDQVNYCHHLASVVCRLSSVVCKLFTFQASSPKPLGRLEPNLAGMFLGWSSTKLLFFVPVGYSICLPGPIICSD